MHAEQYNSIYLDVIKQHPEFIGYKRRCNICGYMFSQFSIFNTREDKCPVCGSLGRHRHLYLHLASLFPFLRQKKVLHFAPERYFKAMMRGGGVCAEYVDADITQGRATHIVDMTKIQFADSMFDYVIAMHVLEHVEDDDQALKELHRVLKPDGSAILCVPWREGKTYENKEITDPAQREKEYGHPDHVRYYGKESFMNKLRSLNFSTRVSVPGNFPRLMREEMGLREQIIFARKKEKGGSFTSIFPFGKK